MRAFITSALLTLSLAAHAASPTAPAAGKYNLDPMHSKVGFEVPHLVISSVEGHFKNFSGVITVDDKFEKSKVETSVDIASIDTSVTDRDTHLKSPDFFDAAKYPKMTFKSTGITGTPQSFKLTGDLTIKNVTKKVTFDATYKGSVVDAYGNSKIAINASTKISRKEFGLTWNKAVEAGPVVGDEVTLDLKIQAAKDVPAKK